MKTRTNARMARTETRMERTRKDKASRCQCSANRIARTKARMEMTI